MGRYILQPSKRNPGWYVLTDTEARVVLRFKEHAYNDTQQITFLDDCVINDPARDAVAIARVLRQMAEYMATEHYNIAMPPLDMRPDTPGGFLERKEGGGFLEEKRHRKEIGSRLREIRESQGLSLVEIAERSGIRPASVSKIEQGKFRVDLDVLHRIASAMGCRVDIVPD